RNDYAEGIQLLSGRTQATLMGWIKIPANYNADGVLFGQENFYVRINASKSIRITSNSNHLSYNVPFETDRWYHVAAVFNGSDLAGKLRLYINGKQVKQETSGVTTLNASTSKFTIGKFATSANFFFNGSLDEVRVFGTALTADQIQKMVYQEIDRNGNAIRGTVIPRDIEASTWASLLAYYRFDVFKHNVIDDFT